MPKLLTCQNLSKSYGKKTILKDINFDLEPGKIVGLLGKNGAGKTTLIKLISGLLIPTSGTILVKNHPIGVESKSLISYLPEHTYLDKSMTINQTLNLFSDFYRDFNPKKAQKLLKDFDLDPSARLIKLSKGMQEKVQLSLVMARKAKLYILDEPFGGVDPASRDYILDTILQNFDDGASMIISTHLISDIERILDQVIFLDHGEIKLIEDAETLREKSGQSIDGYFRKEFKDVH